LASFDTLVPAFAASIHKSQGSEYPAVVIPVMTQHYAMLQRPSPSPCATSQADGVGETGGMAERGRLEA
jgi:UvrD-like helicase C-terminal domain